MEKTITKDTIRQLTEKGLKLADSITEDMNTKQQDSEKYKEKYQNVLKRVQALLDSEK
jgi:hypothetical protein